MRTVTLKEIWVSFICVQRSGQCVNTLAITALKRKRTWREITTPYVITFPITNYLPNPFGISKFFLKPSSFTRKKLIVYAENIYLAE